MKAECNADFEYQEMKVILDALQREGIVASNRMDRNKANELNSYLQRIVSDRTTTTNNKRSSLPSRSLSSSSSSAAMEQQLHSLWNTSWTMKYTTMDILPPDTTIQLQFLAPPSTMNAVPNTADMNDLTSVKTSKMRYRLLFGSKTLGLNALNVDCDWRPFWKYNNNHNLIQPSLTFDTITMDAFGFENVPLCLLSNLLFRNRSNNQKDNRLDNAKSDIFINTVYMDDTIWIEQQQQQQQQVAQDKSYDIITNELNNVIWNVYQKDATCV
jgi:hypothetical protein